MRNRLQLPRRNALPPVDPDAEPTRYYYWPLVGWFYRKRLQMALDALEARPYPRLLEVACGSGLFLPSLRPLCEELHALDRHEHLESVRQGLARLGVAAELRQGDALAMPYAAESFDAVVNVSMLEHLPEPGDAIAEMLRVLKPGGRLVLGFPCRNPGMDAFFRLLGFDPRAIHPSSHQDILATLRQRRPGFTLAVLPRWLPLDFSLYCVCTMTK